MDASRASAKIDVWESGLSEGVKNAYKEIKGGRKQVRIRVTKGVNKLKEFISDGFTSRIEEQVGVVKKAYDDLDKADSAVWSFMEDNDDVIDADVFIGESWSDAAICALAEANDVLNPRVRDSRASSPSQPAATPSSASAPGVQAKLPKVELPKFTGKSPAEYQAFWNSFESLVDQRTDLAPVQKLNYLKGCCVDEASKLADGYNLTPDNYNHFKKALKDMYGLPRLVQQSHIEIILDLQPFKSSSLKPFLTSLETSLRCLAEYSIEMDSLAPLLVPHVERLMPKEIFQKWREHIHNDESFLTSKLLEFLHERLQCCGTSASGQSANSKDESKNKDVKSKTTSLLSSSSREIVCFCCDKPGHKIFDCSIFKRMEAQERCDLLYKKKRCQRCAQSLSKDHTNQNCSRLKCSTCGGKHHTLLHKGRQPSTSTQPENHQEPVSSSSSVSSRQPGSSQSVKPSSESANAITTSESSEEVRANALHHAPSCHREQLTVLKNFQAIPKGSNCFVRSAIDDGSQRTWILQKTAKALKLPVIRRTHLAVATAFSHEFSAPKLFDIVKISLQTREGQFFEMEAVVSQSEKLTVDMDPINMDPSKAYSHLQGIMFADCYPRDAAEIELLIGNDYADMIETGAKRFGKSGEPVAVHTIFGWVLSGRIHQQSARTSSNLTQVSDLGNQLERFWKLEEVPNPRSKMRSCLDEKVYEDFKRTIDYDEDKQQYVVEIPYTGEVTKLCDNYVSTKVLYLKQQEKLKKNPEMRNVVHRIFAEQIQLGVLEKVSSQDTPTGGVHYLPWHIVERPGHPTTPVRIVKNASFKDKHGRSLNAAQHPGPNLLPDIVGSILRFRSHEVAFVTDVKKMFWQVLIPKHQQDLHRIITPEGVMRQTTTMFGESSSPFLCIATCHFHAEREDIKKEYPLACKYILEELYMDDVPSGTDSVTQGIEVVTQLQAFFASMHMRAHKVNSNSKELLRQLDGTDDREVTGVLGVQWNTVVDTLEVPTKVWDQAPATKRQFLQLLAAVWDPFGGQSPLTCKGKMLMQKIWADGCDWDAPLTGNLKAEVGDFSTALGSTFTIPRFFGNPMALHIFCDASEQAYATVAYVVSDRGCKFVLSKTRVKPVKVVTLPRMELLGTLLGSRVLEFLNEEVFKSAIKRFVWTDSTIALGWIVSSSSRYKPFVGNRIAEVQRTLSACSAQALWVPGGSNPADIPSRGIWPLDEVQSKMWLEGPDFLKTGQWPVQPAIEKPSVEVRSTMLNLSVVRTPVVDVSRFGSLENLIQTVVLVIGFGSPLGARESRTTAEERRKALSKLIIQEQQSYFPEETRCLEEKQALPSKSRLLGFNPFIDEDGIMKMDGRVNKGLILLSDKSPLTKLIILDAHIANLHAGANQTLAYLRHRFWILKGMASVKSITKNCIKCKKINQPLCKQFMSELPEFRKNPFPPFKHTGLDYAGPLLVKTKANPEKRWICLFTCASTRGVHLEVVNDLSTEQFLMAFTRFVSRRGKPTHIYSDNATTFTKAAKALPDVNWQFNPPAAPWWGGFWERLVRSIKEPLKKILGKALVTDKELSTLITRIEGQINSRPLTPLTDDPDQVPLTPAEILIGRPLQQAQDVPMEIPSLHVAFSARQKYLKNLQQSWTRRWVQEYLPTLQPRPKWLKPSENLTPGSLVLLKKENQKRHLWPLAKIEEVHVGRDGNVRSATLRDDKNNRFKRPIQNLVLLEGAKDN